MRSNLTNVKSDSTYAWLACIANGGNMSATERDINRRAHAELAAVIASGTETLNASRKATMTPAEFAILNDVKVEGHDAELSAAAREALRDSKLDMLAAMGRYQRDAALLATEITRLQADVDHLNADIAYLETRIPVAA